MACKYWYAGKLHSEQEFKNILNNGLIDQLVKTGKVDLKDFEINEEQLKEFQNLRKSPITLRIRRKIQTRINNQREPLTNDFINNNPITVIEKAISEGAKPFEFIIAIKTKQGIQIADTAKGKKILAQLGESKLNIEKNLIEGVPYMLIPSAYGLYPIQLKSHKIKDTKAANVLKSNLLKLSRATTTDEVASSRKAIEQMLYRTTVTFSNGVFTVNNFETKANKTLTRSFKTVEEVYDFLSNKWFRVDYTKINKSNYNTTIASLGAVTTDLFSEDGNFFNSSSFVLEAYQTVETDPEQLNKVFEFKDTPTEASNNTEDTGAAQNIQTPGSSNNKQNESPIFNTPINEVSEMLESQISREYPIPNSNQKVRVTGAIIDSVFQVIRVEGITRQKRANQNDLVTVVKTYTSGKEYNDAISQFFKDPKVQEKKTTETKTAAEEVAEEANKSIIQKAAEEFVKQETTTAQKKANRRNMIDTTAEIAPVVVDQDSGILDLPFNPDELGLPSTGERPESTEDIKFRTGATTGQVADFEQELDDLENMIGAAFKRGKKGTIKMFKDLESLKNYLPKETYEMLLEARRHGKEIHGVFTQAAMYLSRTALPGTTYHEAFHIVFNLALPLRTRVRILNEALEKYKDELPFSKTTNPKTGETITKFPTYLQIEELLADKFMEFVQQAPRTNYKEFSLITGTKEIGKSFVAMSKMLQVFFSPNRAIDIDQLFKDINMGVYKHSVKFRDTRMPEGTRLMATTAPDMRYENVVEEIYAFGYLETLLDETINEFKTKTGLDLTDKDAINKIGVHKLYSIIVTKLVQEYQGNLNRKNETRANLLGRLYKILTDNQSAIQIKEVDGIKMLEFNRTTDLLSRFNQSLQRRGIFMTYKNAKNTSNNLATEEESNPVDSAEIGENTYEDAWMTNYITLNPQESISARLKSFFATIPKYKSNRKNAAKVISPFGVEVKEDGGDIFKYLISKIANSYTMEDMMNKLRDLEKHKPYIRDILNKLDQDPILKTELWVSVGSKNYSKFVAVYEKNGTYSVINSNRKTLDNIIQEELVANFLQTNNPLLEADGITPNKAAAEPFLKMLTAIRNYLITNRNAEKKPLTKQDILQAFEDLSKVAFVKNKINITAQDLEAIWNPETGKASFANVLKLIDTFIKVGEKLKTGENPFISLLPEEVVDQNVRKEGKSLIESLARQLLPISQSEVVSTFRNIDGKTVYNLILSNFLDKQVDKFLDPEKFEEYLQTIKEDELLSAMPFLKDLANEDLNLQEKLEVVLLDGFSRSGKNKSVGYTEMSDIEIEATSMALFNNSGSYKGKGKVGYFKLPIPSDGSTSGYIKSSTFERPEIIDRLVTIARAEFARIKRLQSEEDSSKIKRIVNFNKNGQKFQILSLLNDKINTKKGFPEAKVREVIEDFFNEDISKSDFFKKEIEVYKRKGVIKSVDYSTGVIVFAENLIDSKLKNTSERVAFFKDYLLNTFYMNTQLTTILGGDPAFYKNTVDYQKRYKQVMSPGLFTDVSESKKTYSGPILKDSIKPTKKETAEAIIELIEKSNLTPQEKQDLKILWSVTLSDTESKDYKGNNESDGATFISIARRKQQLKDLGRWTPEHKAAMKRIKNGTETIEDITLISPPFKPEKPFVYTQRIVDGKMVPTQVKNAETVLTKSFAYRKDASGNYMFPKLIAAYEDMNEGKFDVIYFESAIKEGAIVNIDGEFSDYELQPDGSYKLTENAELLTLNSDDWRLQQETPEHYIDDSALFGTQLRVLITGDMDLNGEYIVAGKKYKGYELARFYQELVVEDLKTSFEEVKQMFMNPDNATINYESLLSVLRQEIIDKELGQEYLDALAPIKDALGNTTSALPLYHPLISYKMESLMNSFFKNRITKQKINGGNLINTTSFGVSEHLKMIVDPKTKAITYQAMLPATSKKFFPKNKNGEVDLEAIKQYAPELLRIIGYRIPTEDKYSMFNIEIVGFTPPSMGGTVILPVEITTIAGLDFDIDKLYFMSRAFSLTAKGNPKAIKYTEDINEIAENIFRSFKDYKAFILKNVSDPKEQDKKLEIQRELIEKQIAEKTEFKKENASLYESLQNLKVELKAAKKMNSPIVNFIQQTIDAQYELLREEFIPFQDDILSQEAIKSAIDFIKKKLKKDFNPIEYNTKQARDNKKLDIIQGILENSNTTTAIVNPGNFDNLKEASSRIRLLQAGKVTEANTLKGKDLVKAADLLDNEDFNINYPSTQLELYRRNMTGKQLIGVFANHNTHHAKAQFTNLSLTNSVEFDNQQFLELNKVYNSKGQRISKLLASSLAAVVDNAKDPISSFLNLNTFTANTVAMLQRLGVNEPTIFALMNQPVILELTQKYFNERGSLSDEKHFSAISGKWKSLLKDKLKNEGIDSKDLSDINLTQEILEKNLVSDGSVDYYQVQLKALTEFEKLYKTADELAKGIGAAKVDTVGVGPTSGTNYVMLHNQQRIINKNKNKTNKIIGLEEIFLGGADQLIVPAFTKYGLQGPINILNRIYPSIGEVNINGEVKFSVLGELKNEFAAQKSSGFLKEKEAHMIDIHFMNFIASKFPFFKYSQAQDILSNIPKRLLDFKKSMDNFAPYKPFIDKLYVVEKNNYSPIRRVEFYSTGKTPIETQQLKYAWQRMLEDTDPTVKQLAQDLVKYTYFTNGYGFGPYSFANMVPVKFWTNEYQLANNIVDSVGRPFNEFLKDALNEENLIKDSAPWKNRFINQFIRNNGDKEPFLMTVKEDVALKKEKEGTTAESINNVVTKEAYSSKGGVVLTSKGYLVINESKNQQLIIDGRPVKYIKRYVQGKVKFYEHVETAYDKKNPADFDNRNYINTITYKPISSLGTPNFTLEYDFDNDIQNSILDKIKGTPNPTIAKQSMAATLAAEQDAIEAAMRAEIESGMLPAELGQTLGSITGPTAPTTRKYTPENITTLQPNQVFVFGANTAGGHGGGTAGLAQRGTASSNYTALPTGTKGKWSEYGVVDKLMQGTEGKSFGIVTKAASISGTALKIGSKRSVPLSRIEQSINALINEANNHPELEFLVTKFGTNMAGFTIEEMKSLLVGKTIPDNIILPKEFEVRTSTISKVPTTVPASITPATTPKSRRAAMMDQEGTERLGLFENINWKDYQELGGTMPQSQFIALSLDEQETIIEQLKNCKKNP